MIIRIAGDKQTITTVDEWFKAAPPKGEKTQWKEGRSAMEMARFAVSKEFPAFILRLTKWAGIDDQYYKCEPEAKTSFEKGMGISGPRNHDLLMVGDNSIIGVEAKVSESFDKTLQEKKVGASANMLTRLTKCKEYLFGDNIPSDADELYYQLFSATIGTIIEAKRRHKNTAVALFVTFKGKVSKEPNYSDNVKINNDAFVKFCAALGLGPEGGKLKYIPGLGEDQIDCFIKKVDVNIGNNFHYEY